MVVVVMNARAIMCGNVRDGEDLQEKMTHVDL